MACVLLPVVPNKAGRRAGPASLLACARHRVARHFCTPAPLPQWDVSYWAERLKEAKYALEEEALRPYFALPNVLEVRR